MDEKKNKHVFSGLNNILWEFLWDPGDSCTFSRNSEKEEVKGREWKKFKKIAADGFARLKKKVKLFFGNIFKYMSYWQKNINQPILYKLGGKENLHPVM